MYLYRRIRNYSFFLRRVNGNLNLQTIELDKEQISWSLSQGHHGELFHFTIYTTYLDGSESQGITTDCIFTQYSKFNNPVIFINIPNSKEITTKKWLSSENNELAECLISDKNKPNNSAIKLEKKKISLR